MLEKEAWNHEAFLDVRHSNADRYRVFYPALHNYLAHTGPNAPKEILSLLLLFLPDEQRDWGPLRSRFENIVLKHWLDKHRLRRYGIRSTEIYDVLKQYLPHGYHVLNFYLEGVSCISGGQEKPERRNAFYNNTSLLYTNNESLESFIRRYYGGIKKHLHLYIPPIQKRIQCERLFGHSR
jgi:hypothetical protein